MNFWWLICSVVFLGSTSANTISYRNVVISNDRVITTEDLLKNLTKSVIEFDKNLDEYIDWVSFDKMFAEMLDHNGSFSIGSIGTVRKYFLESRDLYFQAVTSVYGWCGLIDGLLHAYIQMFQIYEPGVRDDQKKIIISCLDTGVEKMEKSLEYLDRSRENANTGIVELSDVMSNISEAFRHDQSEHDTRLHQLNQQAMDSMGKSLVGGIINLIMVEAKYKPEARENFAKIESSFSFMKTKIMAAIEKALEIKIRLLAEIQNVVELQAAAKSNRVLMEFNYLTVIKDSAVALRTKCHDYQVKHGLKV